MEINEKLEEACHALWLKIKLLHLLLEYIASIVDLSDNNDAYPDIWNDLMVVVNEILNIINGSLIMRMLDNSAEKTKLWDDYEQLIEYLAKLLLLKDYNIISNYDDFMCDIIDKLVLFENELKIILLGGPINKI